MASTHRLVNAGLLSLLLIVSLFIHCHQGQAAAGEAPFLEVDYYSSPSAGPLYFLVVEKQHQKLTLYEFSKTLETIEVFQCATGENPGIKLTSGDERTPEGIYFITEFFQDSKITIFGDRAYHLDYPNIFDLQAGRRGDGIYIHGTDKALKPFSTNGCISMANNDLDRLAPYLEIARVPVIIVDKLPQNFQPVSHPLLPGKETFEAVLEKLGFPPTSMDASRIDQLLYLQLGDKGVARIEYNEYDGEYTQYRFRRKTYLAPGLSSHWRAVQTTESQEPVVQFLARNVTKKNFPVTESDILVSQGGPSPSQRKAASQGITGGILPGSATAAPIPPLPQPPETDVKGAAPEQLPPAAATEQSTNSTIDRGETVLQFVENWRSAWQNKELERYMACYANDFHSGGLDKASWRKKKARLNNTYAYIRVTVRDIVIEWVGKDGARVSFFQDYESDRYRSNGTKTLLLKEHQGSWQISKEYM